MTTADVLLKLKATAREAKKEVRKLGAEMRQSLEQDLEAKLRINDEELAKTESKLQILERERIANIFANVETSSYAKAEAQLQALERERNVRVRTNTSQMEEVKNNAKEAAESLDEAKEGLDANAWGPDSTSGRTVIADGGWDLPWSNQDRPEERRTSRNLRPDGDFDPNLFAEEFSDAQIREWRDSVSMGDDQEGRQSWQIRQLLKDDYNRFSDPGHDRANVDRSGSWKSADRVYGDIISSDDINISDWKGDLRMPPSSGRDQFNPEQFAHSSGSSMHRQRSTLQRVTSGQYGRNVHRASGRRGLVASDRSDHDEPGGLFRTSQDDGDRRQVGPQLKRPSGFEKSIRNIRKEARRMSQEFDISELHMGNLKEHGSTFVKNFRKYSPNIMMWWKLVALLLPMMIALRVQAAGVAVAMWSMAAAGQALVMGGLLGHGTEIEDSMALMERRINELKRELFQTFSPVFQEFAPISERFLGTLASRLQPLVDTLRNLTEFEGAIFRTFDDLIRHVNNLLQFGMQWVDTFEQVGRRFMAIVFERIERFLTFLFNTMEQEQDMIIGLIRTFTAVVNIVWQLLKLVSKFGAMISPIVEIFSWLATVISNNAIASLVAMIAIMYVLIAVVNSLIAGLVALSVTALGTFASHMMTAFSLVRAGLVALQQQFMAFGLTAKQAWAMATLGTSLAITGLAAGTMWMSERFLTPDTDDFGGGAGGAPGGSGAGGAAAAPVYNTTINVDGEMSRSQRYEVEDIAREVGEQRDEEDEDRAWD